MKQTNRTLLVATAAATLLLTGAVVARASDAKGGEVHCAGINACKGQGSCAGAGNACKAQNECKGKGIGRRRAAPTSASRRAARSSRRSSG